MNLKTKMASLKLNLTRQNPTQLIATTDLVTDKLAPAAPATPPIPNMAAKVTAILLVRDVANDANDAYESAKAALVNLKQVRDMAADALRIELGALGSSIEGEAKGNPAMLTASGFPLAGSSSGSTVPPGKVMNLSITSSDLDAAVDGTHDPESLAGSYDVELTTVHPVTGPYTLVLQPTSSSWQLPGLTSGQRIWVRVRAIGSNGPGPWSDPATKIVP